jgi:hypothetical protein
MKKVTKAILTLLGTFSLFFLQADALIAPLRDIIAKLKKEKGIWFKLWFKGSEFVLDEKISAQFSDLSVDEGLGRIFSLMNYSLVFDQHDDVVGVFLLRKYQKSGSVRRRSVPHRRRAPRRFPPP